MNRLCLIIILSATIPVNFSSTYVKTIQVPENYRGTFPWYLTKVELEADGRYNAELAGNDEGIFELDPESGFLCALKPFDRENKESYIVTVTGEHRTVIVYIKVTDDNDNMPILDQSTLHGIVNRGSRAGVAFLHVQATDADDPDSENADLRYVILDSDQNLFQIDPRSGAMSLTEEGVTYLSQAEESHFKLAVQVKDMGDDPKGYVASGSLEIHIAEDTWVRPIPVSIPENRKGNYPQIISKVLWNSTEVRYRLSGNFAGDLFTVDESGNLHVTEELDWERQSQYQIQVSALNVDDVLYSDPLEITVTVMDENDNGPVFSRGTYHVEITEATAKGSLLIELKAEDADDPASSNAQIRYKIVSQEPQLLRDDVFHIGESTGRITLLDDGLKAATAKRYTLEVLAADLGGAERGLSTSCTVIIDVVDLNNNPPVFMKNQFPPFVVSEDTEVGGVVTTLTATDEDEDIENKLTDFSIVSGNEDQSFGLTADEERSTVSIVLVQDLDFEQVNEYTLVIEARNKAELSGAEYGQSSTATILISVGNVNESPVFTVSHYEVQVPENSQIGSIILTVEASDPDVSDQTSLRYGIINDSRKWFSIQEDSGEIKLLHSLDREQFGDTYHMQIIARDRGDPGLTATADVTIQILDVNDNIPNLVGDYTNEYFCTPKREEQRLIIRACDRDSVGNGAPFTFRLPDDATRSRQWKVTVLNGTHAYLSMAVRYIEPAVHHVTIVITDNGTDPQSKNVQLKVTVCRCNTRGHCKIDVDRMEGMPTVSSALGIILGTLGAIGLILIIIFCHLALSHPIKKNETPDTIPLQTTA
ncbi:cadherin-16 isoform X1 [Rhinoderma darwinii]|uniref:cadherin-16 isoform X1 n=1 Tax=Rhinoderma darwinii TaxID=43563 RepID=UPI003F676AA4